MSNNNPDLNSLFDNDTLEHAHEPLPGTPAYRELVDRDARRRYEVGKLIRARALHTAEDYYRAAVTVGRSDHRDDWQQALRLAHTSTGMGHESAHTLVETLKSRRRRPLSLPPGSVASGCLGLGAFFSCIAVVVCCLLLIFLDFDEGYIEVEISLSTEVEWASPEKTTRKLSNGDKYYIWRCTGQFQVVGNDAGRWKAIMVAEIKQYFDDREWILLGGSCDYLVPEMAEDQVIFSRRYQDGQFSLTMACIVVSHLSEGDGYRIVMETQNPSLWTSIVNFGAD